jgi:hypothetical protein
MGKPSCTSKVSATWKRRVKLEYNRLKEQKKFRHEVGAGLLTPLITLPAATYSLPNINSPTVWQICYVESSAHRKYFMQWKGVKMGEGGAMYIISILEGLSYQCL